MCGQRRSKLTGDTLISVSLEPMRMVTKLNRKTLRAPEKSGHHNMPGGNQEVLGVVHSARLCHRSTKTAREKQQREQTDGKVSARRPDV